MNMEIKQLDLTSISLPEFFKLFYPVSSNRPNSLDVVKHEYYADVKEELLNSYLWFEYTGDTALVIQGEPLQETRYIYKSDKCLIDTTTQQILLVMGNMWV